MASRAAARRRRQREVAARWAQPQVEVSHEFDSTGLLNVDAEDKDFGKRAANQPSSLAFEIDSAGFLNVGAEDDGAVKGEKITITYDEGRLTEETTPAPRGQSQIEQTFEIDSNGLLHVGAEDKGPAILAPDICGPEAVAPREPPAAAERGPPAHRGDLLRDPVRAAPRAPAAAEGHDLVLPPAADGVPHAGAPCEPLAADDRELLALPAGAARDPLADAPREPLAADDRELLALPARAARDPLADAPREPLAADDREFLVLPARAARDSLADAPREPLAADDRELFALPARAARDPLIDAPRGPLAADDRELFVLPARAARDPLADAPREPLAADDREHFALRAGAVRDPFDEAPRELSAPDKGYRTEGTGTLKSDKIAITNDKGYRTEGKSYNIGAKGKGTVKSDVTAITNDKGYRTEGKGTAKSDKIDITNDKGYRTEGKACDTVTLAEKIPIKTGKCFAIVVNRGSVGHLMVGSRTGGTSIVDLVAADPTAIVMMPIGVKGHSGKQAAKDMAFQMGFEDEHVAFVAGEISRLYEIFFEYALVRGCTMMEVNPLAELTDGRVIIGEPKWSFDDKFKILVKLMHDKCDDSKADRNYFKPDGRRNEKMAKKTKNKNEDKKFKDPRGPSQSGEAFEIDSNGTLNVGVRNKSTEKLTKEQFERLLEGLQRAADEDMTVTILREKGLL